MKLDLLTNATVVDDAIKFVSSKFRSKERESAKESNKPDYDDSVNEKSSTE